VLSKCVNKFLILWWGLIGGTLLKFVLDAHPIHLYFLCYLCQIFLSVSFRTFNTRIVLHSWTVVLLILVGWNQLLFKSALCLLKSRLVLDIIRMFGLACLLGLVVLLGMALLPLELAGFLVLKLLRGVPTNIWKRFGFKWDWECILLQEENRIKAGVLWINRVWIPCVFSMDFLVRVLHGLGWRKAQHILDYVGVYWRMSWEWAKDILETCRTPGICKLFEWWGGLGGLIGWLVIHGRDWILSYRNELWGKCH